jgi:hypothetical protein
VAADWPPLPTTIQGLAGPVAVRRPVRIKGGCEGLWLPHSREILVRSTLPREYAWMTLLHEVCHAVEHDAGFTLEETDKTSVPDALASGMMHVLRALIPTTPA